MEGLDLLQGGALQGSKKRLGYHGLPGPYLHNNRNPQQNWYYQACFDLFLFGVAASGLVLSHLLRRDRQDRLTVAELVLLKLNTMNG